MLFQFQHTFGQLLRCFAGTLLLQLCLLLRPILKFWSVGATLMRLTWAKKSERRILVSNSSATRNSLRELHTLDWLPHVCALSKNRLRRRHVLKYTTPIVVHQMVTRFPRSIVTLVGNRSSFFPITFLQKSHSTFVIFRFWTFSSAVHQPDDVRMSTFLQTDNHFWSCRTSILEGAISHKMSYCKFL